MPRSWWKRFVWPTREEYRQQLAIRRGSWAARWFPELDLFDSDVDRGVALCKAQNTVERSVRFWSTYIVLLASCGGIGIVQAAVWPRLIPPRVAAIVMASIFGAASILLFRSAIRADLRRQLAERDVRFCARCDYNLTGNVSGVCPECGTKIEPAPPQP